MKSEEKDEEVTINDEIRMRMRMKIETKLEGTVNDGQKMGRRV